MNLANVPVRVATGAFILNSGLGKLKADEGTAQPSAVWSPSSSPSSSP